MSRPLLRVTAQLVRRVAPPAFALEGVTHRYGAARGELAPAPILDDVHCASASAGLIGVRGASGAGKSTLLRMLACMEAPCAGRVYLRGALVPHANARALRAHREDVALALQAAPLLAHLDARQNAAIPLLLRGFPTRETLRAAGHLLAALGLERELQQLPHELSGGQKQRVALARALLCGEHLVLADEPTAGLDAATTMLVIELLRASLSSRRRAIVVASHDARLLDRCDVVYELSGGKLHECGPEAPATAISEPNASPKAATAAAAETHAERVPAPREIASAPPAPGRAAPDEADRAPDQGSRRSPHRAPDRHVSVARRALAPHPRRANGSF